MPELANYRRELFSRYYLVTNGNQTKAAKLANYSPATARLTGYRLMQDDAVKRRIKELKEASFEEREITPELITKAFWKEYTEATHSRDKKGALDSLARIRGMFTDNVNQGSTKDMKAVLASLRGILPDEHLDMLAKQFGVETDQPKATHEASGSVN